MTSGAEPSGPSRVGGGEGNGQRGTKVDTRSKGALLRNERAQGAVGGVGVGFLIGLLIFGDPWHLPPAWGDIPTWISAIATIGLLIGAIITAKYAIKAFGKQSQQLEDQREINKLQARDLESSLEERKRLRQVAERYTVRHGYNLVTGLGIVNGKYLVPELARSA
jgi:hypothetical protein